MLTKLLALCFLAFASGISDDVSDEVPPNIVEFELTFGEECTVPALPEFEKILRQLFDLGVVLYDADLDE